jgi:hypothetical protein
MYDEEEEEKGFKLSDTDNEDGMDFDNDPLDAIEEPIDDLGLGLDEEM